MNTLTVKASQLKEGMAIRLPNHSGAKNFTVGEVQVNPSGEVLVWLHTAKTSMRLSADTDREFINITTTKRSR